jgi:predicted MFS family arabinose efflux permease
MLLGAGPCGAPTKGAVEGSKPYQVLFALWLLVFSASSQIMIISPILTQIGADLSIHDAVLGTLVSSYTVMVGIFAVISGPVSDRIGRRKILLLGSGSMTVFLLLHSLVTGYWSLMAVRVLAGAAGGILSGAAVAYIGDYFPYERRGWATGWVMSGSAFGQILGIPIGIFLAGSFGFRSPFFLFSATMGLTFLLVWLRVPQPQRIGSFHPLSITTAVREYLEMLKEPGVAAASGSFFFLFMGMSLFVVYLPAWLERGVGAQPSEIAVLFLLGGIGNALAGLQAGKLSDRIGRRSIILCSCVGLSVVMALTTVVVVGMAVAYPLFFLAMVLMAMRVGPFSAMLTALVSHRQRGSLMSLTVAVGQAGYALGGAVSGLLFVQYGYRSDTGVGAVAVLLMGVLVWNFVPEPRALCTGESSVRFQRP